MPGSRSAPTLEDVARTAGVSTATVSRCLNAPTRVVQETREKVLTAVEKLGYTPNFGARVMAAKRTFTIGAIIPTMENAIFARGLQAFQEELHERGYTLLVSSTAYRPEVEKEQLLLIGHERDPALFEYLKRQEVPALVAWTFIADSAQPSIGFDNRASMMKLVQQVLDLGHRTIGVISAQTIGNDRAAQRLQGVKDCLAANGLSPDSLQIIMTTYDVENGAESFAQLMSAPDRPTAVICGNDVLAVGALRQARQMGIDVPTDVSVTGFDDIELARIVVPALTTVHVPHREMGRRAAIELVEMVEGKSAGTSIELPSSLQIRDSLGSVKQT
jgi:LacI family transcriptional regulator